MCNLQDILLQCVMPIHTPLGTNAYVTPPVVAPSVHSPRGAITHQQLTPQLGKRAAL